MAAAALACSAAVHLAGCSDSGDAAGNDRPAKGEIISSANDEAKAAAQAANAFGIELFKQTKETTAAGNRFLSPVSAFLALAMAYNGAVDATAAEMHETLTLGDMSRDEANEAARSLMRTLLGSNFEMNIANSIWVRQGFALSPDFANRVSSAYDAQSRTLDFNSSSASKTINGWVDEQTRGKIDSIVPAELDADLVTLIINAVYFKADWQQPFDPSHTRMQAFSAADGAVEVPMMGGDGTFRYVKTGDAELIELPYGREQQLASMIVVKPAGDLDAFVEALSPQRWRTMVGGLYEAEPQLGMVAMPKLELDYSATLNSPLMAMGMPRAFSGRAQFDDLLEGSSPLNISEVIQKTYLNVDEKGTKAAVTSVGRRVRSMPIYAFQLVVDRPYFFVIRDNRSGAILFAGAIHKPEGGKLPAK